MKGYLVRAECSINRKGKICEDLDRFYRYKGIQWTKPNYQRIDTLPFVPTTQEANDLIACVGPKMSVFALLLKETGCRFNEGFGLRWQDINIENNTVTITPLKGSYARQMKVSAKLMLMDLGVKSRLILGAVTSTVERSKQPPIGHRCCAHNRVSIREKQGNQ